MGTNRLHHSQIVVGARSVDLIEPERPFDGDVLEAFKDSISELLSWGRRDIRVGCRWMTWLDSAGVGTLMGALMVIRRHKGRLAVDYQGNELIEELFLLTQLDQLFASDRDGDGPDDGMAGKTSPLIPPLNRGAPGRAQELDWNREDPDR